MSEAGVELQDGEAEKGETELGDVFTPEDEKGTKRSLQLQAAEEFLKLPQGLSYPVDRMYYYQYTSPSVTEQEKHVFDSALLEENPGPKANRIAWSPRTNTVPARLKNHKAVNGANDLPTACSPTKITGAHQWRSRALGPASTPGQRHRPPKLPLP